MNAEPQTDTTAEAEATQWVTDAMMDCYNG